MTGLSLPYHLPLYSKDTRASGDLRIPEYLAREIGNASYPPGTPTLWIDRLD